MKRRLMIVLAAAVCAVAAALFPPQETLASWADNEYATGSFTAGTINVPANLHCTAGLLSNVTFYWNAPGSGLTPTSYGWSVSGAFSDSGTTASTQVTLNSGILAIGTATFSVHSIIANWTSSSVTGTVHVIGVLVPVSTSCSVP